MKGEQVEEESTSDKEKGRKTGKAALMSSTALGGVRVRFIARYRDPNKSHMRKLTTKEAHNTYQARVQAQVQVQVQAQVQVQVLVLAPVLVPALALVPAQALVRVPVPAQAQATQTYMCNKC